MAGMGTMVRQPTAPPGLIGGIGQTSLSSDLLINATGEKAAFCGPVWFKERTGTKQIVRVGFLFGTITKASGSALTVSIQNISTTASLQPDEVQDQTVAIANGDAGFVSNAWYRTSPLSANRTVSFGEDLAVVVEFDGAGRLGSDAVRLRCLTGTSSWASSFSWATLKAGGWGAALESTPNIILEFSDGTFGTLLGAFPLSGVGVQTYHAASAKDEYALQFSFETAEDVEAASFVFNQFTTIDCDSVLSLYDGTTVLATAPLPSAHFSGGGAGFSTGLLDSVPRLVAGQTYRLGIRALGADFDHSMALDYYQVADAAHWQAHVGGPSWVWTARVDQGAWDAPTLTRRPFLWPHIVIEGFDEAEAAAAGPAIGPIAWVEFPRRVT